MNRLWQHRYEMALQVPDQATREYQLKTLAEEMRRAASKASLEDEIVVASFLLQQALKLEIKSGQ